MLDCLLYLATSPVLFGVVALILSVVYCIKTWTHHPSDYPPVPCRPLPVVGHALYLKPTPAKAILAWREKLGPIFSIYIGSKLHIVMSSTDVLREALVKQANHFSDRPFSKKTSGAIIPDTEKGVTTSSGAPWKEQRTLILSIFRSFGMGKNWLAEKMSEEVNALLREFDKTKNMPHDYRTLINTSIANVICAILVGHRFEFNDPYFVRFMEIFNEQVQLMQTTSLVSVFPWLRHLPGDLFKVKKLKKNTLEVREMFSDYHIKKFTEDMDDTSTDNFIKAFLREMKRKENEGIETYLDVPTLRRNIDSLFLAGGETTSTTILWSFVYSVNFPHTQKKVYKEIEEIVGKRRIPGVQDKPKLNYLNAFIMETMRYSSVVPLSVPHICSNTTRIAGYTIPKGAVVFPHLNGVLSDRKAWGDPEVFRPERFLDQDGGLVTLEDFMPFSLGRRVCLGESLARMELFIFMSAIYQSFEILPEDPNNPPSLEPIFGIVSSPKPFRVQLQKRN